jgi:putative NADPH-quinone reductase
MKALVVHCHPREGSFTAAVRDVVLERLAAAGAEVRLTDLYAEGFQPILSAGEWDGYLRAPDNRAPVDRHCADLLWCDTLIFVYPTWWYGLPAMLKGWLDRVLLPGVAFLMPDAAQAGIRPNLHHIRRLGVFTTCGASWWLTLLVGAPGRRTLTRGVGFLCHPRHRRAFAALYRMDGVSPEARQRHLGRVARRMDRLLGSRTPQPAPMERPAE